MPERNDQPRRIGPYLTERLLGEGGMGRVHLARPADDPAAPPVALKVVHPYLARDPEFRARFQREVAVARAVSSRHVVPVVDADPLADEPWLAGAYVPGPTLERVVADGGPLPEDRLRALAVALASALADIHAAGLVHRDLKPSNVLMHPEHGPQVIDFGIARAVDGTRLTMTGAVLGTPGFMPPELFREGTSGAAGDVFALGAVLAYAATGRSPFGDAPPAVLAYRTVHEEPDLTGVPEPLDELVRRCLAKDPAERPAPQEVIAAARAAQSRVPQTPAPTRFDHMAATRRDTVPVLPRRAGRLPARRALVAVAFVTVPAVAVAGLLFVDGRGTGSGHAGSGPRLAAAVRGGDPLPGIRAEGDRRRIWTALPPDPDLDNKVVGGWLSSKALVRIGVSGVRGYAPATGEQLWAVPAPVQDLVPCNASSGRLATSGGVGVIGYGRPYTDPPACEEVAALDTTTGRLLWHRRVGPPPNALNVAAASGDVLVTSGEEGVLGLDRATGREVWKYRWVDGECKITEVVPGPTTVAVAQSCETTPSERLARVVELDAGSGRERNRHDWPGKWSVELLSAEPLVAGYLDREGGTHWTGLRDPGARPHDLPLRQEPGTADPKVLTDGTTLVADLEESVNGSTGENLVAVDVPTGGLLWRQRIVDGVDFFLLHISGDSVFTVEDVAAEDTDLEWKVVRRRLSDGAVVAEGTVPASFDEGFAGVVLASGGLVVRVNEGNGPGLAAFDIGRS